MAEITVVGERVSEALERMLRIDNLSAHHRAEVEVLIGEIASSARTFGSLRVPAAQVAYLKTIRHIAERARSLMME